MSLTILWVFITSSQTGLKGVMILGASSAYILVTIALFKGKSIMKCINSAAKVYCMSSSKCPKQEVIAFLTLFSPGYTLLLVAVFSHMDITQITFSFLYEITSMPLLATSLLISTLCVVCERAFIHINQQLTELSDCHLLARAKCQLEVLEFQFERVTDVMEEIIHGFGLMLATILTDFILRLIVSSCFMSRIPRSESFEINIIFCIAFMAIYSLKFFIICKCSQQIQNQVCSIICFVYIR